MKTEEEVIEEVSRLNVLIDECLDDWTEGNMIKVHVYQAKRSALWWVLRPTEEAI